MKVINTILPEQRKVKDLAPGTTFVRADTNEVWLIPKDNPNVTFFGGLDISAGHRRAISLKDGTFYTISVETCISGIVHELTVTSIA